MHEKAREGSDRTKYGVVSDLALPLLFDCGKRAQRHSGCALVC